MKMKDVEQIGEETLMRIYPFSELLLYRSLSID